MSQQRRSKALWAIAVVTIVFLFTTIALNFAPSGNGLPIKPLFLAHDPPDDAAYVTAEAANIENATITPIQPYASQVVNASAVPFTAPVQATTPAAQKAEQNASADFQVLQQDASQLGPAYQSFASQHGVNPGLNFTIVLVEMGNATQSILNSLAVPGPSMTVLGHWTASLSLSTSSPLFTLPPAPKIRPVLGAVAVQYNGAKSAFSVVPASKTGIAVSSIPAAGTKAAGQTFTVFATAAAAHPLVKSIATNNFYGASGSFVKGLGSGTLFWSQK